MFGNFQTSGKSCVNGPHPTLKRLMGGLVFLWMSKLLGGLSRR